MVWPPYPPGITSGSFNSILSQNSLSNNSLNIKVSQALESNKASICKPSIEIKSLGYFYYHLSIDRQDTIIYNFERLRRYLIDLPAAFTLTATFSNVSLFVVEFTQYIQFMFFFKGGNMSWIYTSKTHIFKLSMRGLSYFIFAFLILQFQFNYLQVCCFYPILQHMLKNAQLVWLYK